MDGKMRTIVGIAVVCIVMALVMGFAVSGCKKSEPTTETAAEPAVRPGVEAEVKKAVTEAIEQTTCPVDAGPINKDIFVEYKGKKVYFCCEDCKTKFEENPEQYIAKLPQFKK